MITLFLFAAAIDTTGFRLPPCPGSPNCVSTMEDRDGWSMAPWSWKGDLPSTLEALRRVIGEHPRMTIVKAEGPHIWVEAKTILHLFTDDVQFYVDEDAGLVHFRSASRVGQGDLGVNRRRMKKLAKRYSRIE